MFYLVHKDLILLRFRKIMRVFQMSQRIFLLSLLCSNMDLRELQLIELGAPLERF
jgi:hypothetical protein